jgi:hypothetical protein
LIMIAPFLNCVVITIGRSLDLKQLNGHSDGHGLI